MKIKRINKSGKWTDYDKNYLKLLSSDKSFLSLVEQAREGIGLNKKNLPSKFESGEALTIATTHANKIIDIYDLPESWGYSLCFLIVSGQMVKPSSIGILTSGLKYSSHKKDFTHPDPLSIVIYENVGYDQLWNFIRQNKDTIRNELKKLPRKRSKIKNFDAKLVAFKEYNRTKDIKKVIKLLDKKYGDSAPDEPTVRNWINRLEKALKGVKIT